MRLTGNGFDIPFDLKSTSFVTEGETVDGGTGFNALVSVSMLDPDGDVLFSGSATFGAGSEEELADTREDAQKLLLQGIKQIAEHAGFEIIGDGETDAADG